MNVESGPSISVSPGPAVSVAVGPSISVGHSVSAGIEASLNSRFGPSISGPESFSSPIVNEGPVGSLAGFRPMEAVGIGSLDTLQPKPNLVQEPLAKQEVLAEANYWLGIVEPVKDKVLSEPRIIREVEYPKPQVVIAPALEPAAKTVPKAESNVVNKQTQAVAVPTVRIQEQEVVEERKILRKEETEQPTKVKKSEQSSLHKVKFSEAVKISEIRKWAIKAAIKILAGKNIVGKRVIELLSEAFWRSKSPIAKEGKDWTIDLTARSIESDAHEYKSVEEAEKAWVEFVDQHIPVKAGEGGRIATFEEVREVLSGEDMEIIKPNTPAEIVIRRVAKKSVEIAQGDKMVKVLEDQIDTSAEPNEPTLKKLGLAEIFQRAV